MHLVVDIQILRNILRSNSFFASTSILVLTGMITVFGATDRAIDFVQDLPFPASVSYELWKIKVLILVVVFIYAFSKYGWAMRQLNYCSIMIGAIAGFESVTDAGRSRTRNAAVVATTASTHTNRGIRHFLSWPGSLDLAYPSDCADGVCIDCRARVVSTRVPFLDIAIDPVEYREAR